MSILLRAAGTYVFGTGNITPTIPGSPQVGDMMLCIVGTKPYNGVNTLPAGWTSIGSATDGTVATSAADLGSTKTEIFWKRWSPGEVAPLVTNATNDVSTAVIMVFYSSVGYAFATPVGAGGGDATADTALSITAGSNPGITVGDMLVAYAAIRSDAGTQSAISIAATGATIAAFTESPAADGVTTLGFDMAMSGGYALCTAGTASAAPVYASTLAAAHTGSAFIVRLREVPGTNYATWNPNDKSATITLSGGNLIANATAADSGLRSTIAVSSGKHYWEVVPNIPAGQEIGVGKTGETIGRPYLWVSGYIMWCDDGIKGNSNLSGGLYNPGGAIPAGTVVGVKLDMDGLTISLIVGGVDLGIMYSISAGTYHAVFGNNAFGAAQVTANFGATAFVNAVPSGYRAGLYSGDAPPTVVAMNGRAGGSSSAVGVLSAVASISGQAAGQATAVGNLQSAASGGSLLLDLYGTAKAAYSFRKLRTAYAGAAIRIRRSSDDTEIDIGFSSNQLDIAAITAFVGANSAYIKTIYDQSGSGFDQTQATLTLQPRIVNAGVLDTDPISGKPMMFNGLTRYFERTNVSIGRNISHLWSFSYARTAASIGAARETIFGFSNNLVNTGTRLSIGKPVSVGTLALVGRRDDAAASVTVFDTTTLLNSTNFLSTSQESFGTTEARIYYNGVLGAYSSAFATAGVTSDTDALSFCVGAQQGALTPWGGNIGEVIIYETDKTADRVSIESNINAYFAATGSTAAMTGVAAGSATVQGAMSGLALLNARTGGQADARASISAVAALTGVIAARATANASIQAVAGLNGRVAGAASAKAGLTAKGDLTGATAGVATVKGDLQNGTTASSADITGVAAGSSTAQGTIVGIASLDARSEGQAAARAAVSAIGAMAAITAGHAQARLSLSGKGSLLGNTAGSSGALLQLSASGSLSGRVAGYALSNAVLSGQALLSGRSASVATVQASLSGRASLTGRASGSTEVVGSISVFTISYPYSQYFWSN